MRVYLKDAIAFMGDIIYEAFAFVNTFCQKNSFFDRKSDRQQNRRCDIIYHQKSKGIHLRKENRFLVLNEIPCFFCISEKGGKRL